MTPGRASAGAVVGVLAFYLSAMLVASIASPPGRDSQRPPPDHTLAVIDSGVARGTSVSVAARYECLPDCTLDIEAPTDLHGTHVAEVARETMSPIGLSVVAYRVTTGNWTDIEGIAEAIEHAGRSGFAVINVSIATFTGTDRLREAVDSLDPHTTVVAAQGASRPSTLCDLGSERVRCVQDAELTQAHNVPDKNGSSRQLLGSSFAAAEVSARLLSRPSASQMEALNADLGER